MNLKPTLLLLIPLFCFFLADRLWADSKDDLAPTVAEPESNNVPVAQEFDAEGAYSSPSEMKRGDAHVGPVDNVYAHGAYVVSPQVKDGILLRLGVDAEQNSFGLPANIALPNTLQSVNAIIGADFAVNDRILVRAELHPGIYSDFVHVTGSDFDMPVQLGGTYLWNKNFQIIFGVQIDLKSDLPIIGLPGFRWQFADRWVLSAIPPRPQLQYELTKAVTLYTGAEIIGGTYTLNNDFGNSHSGPGPLGAGNSHLNGDVADFGEFRVGVGVTWKFMPNLSLDVSGGYVPYREFDYHPDHIGFADQNTIFHNNIGDGGAYTEVGIKGSF